MNERVLKPSGIFAPVAPVHAARQALQPLSVDQVSLGQGFWYDRLRANRMASLVAAAEELERAGNFHNFRVAAGLEEGTYRGTSAIGVPYLFLDSDIYKWLEAISWEIGQRPSDELEQLADQTVALLAAAK